MSAHGTDRLPGNRYQIGFDDDGEHATLAFLRQQQDGTMVACGELYGDMARDIHGLFKNHERLRDAVAEAGELFDEIKDNNWSVRIGRLETIAAWLHWYHQTPGGEGE